MKRSWGTPTAGIGTKTTAHLNLTRSLADDRHFLTRAEIAGLRRRADRPDRHFPSHMSWFEKATR